MSDSGPVSPTVETVEARLLEIVRALPSADSFGTAAPTDLTVRLDQAVATVESAWPPFRCRTGCFACCEDSVPLVTAVEWARLHAFLAAQPELVVVALHDATHERYRSQVDALTYAALLVRGQKPSYDDVPALEMGSCPLLSDGRCSAYDDRPLMCRAYGFMTVADGEALMPLMCAPALDHIQETFPADFALPRFEPFEHRLRQLNGHHGLAHLPLWILAQADLGGYHAPPITDPLAWAKRRLTRSDLLPD